MIAAVKDWERHHSYRTASDDSCGEGLGTRPCVCACVRACVRVYVRAYVHAYVRACTCLGRLKEMHCLLNVPTFSHWTEIIRTGLMIFQSFPPKGPLCPPRQILISLEPFPFQILS